jgi:hypothetical protein
LLTFFFESAFDAPVSRLSACFSATDSQVSARVDRARHSICRRDIPAFAARLRGLDLPRAALRPFSALLNPLSPSPAEGTLSFAAIDFHERSPSAPMRR